MKCKKGVFVYIFGILPLINLIAPFSLYHLSGQSIILLFLILLISLTNPDKFERKNLKVAYIFLVGTSIVILLSFLANFSIASVGMFAGVVYGFLCILLKHRYKLYVFDVFIKVLCIFFFLSIIEYYVFLLTGKGIVLGIVFRGDSPHYHLLLNVIKIVKMRYQFLAAEPGDIGTPCGFLLFILDGVKQYKKQLYMIIIVGLTSLSFAFYVFFVMYLVWNASRINANKVVTLIFLVMFVGIFMHGRIEQYIIQRYSEEQYDNRSSDSFDVEFGRYIKSNDVWFGKGYGSTDKIDDFSNVVGLKRELYEVGLIGIIFVFLAFSIPYFRLNKMTFKLFVFFMVFWLSYYQRSNIYNFGIEFLFFNVGALAAFDPQEVTKGKNYQNENTLY